MPGKPKRIAVWVPEKREYIVNWKEAQKWKCGKCIKHRLGFCPMGDKCTLSHETDEELQARNERNKLGGYLEGTKKDGYEWLAKEVKKGKMTFPAGTFNADAPELKEALDYFSKAGKWDDVEKIQSFITANKTGAKPDADEIPLSEEEELEAQDFLDDMLIECEETEAAAFARTSAWAPNGDAPTEKAVVDWEFDNFQDEEERQDAFLWACQFLADYELYALDHMAKEASAQRWACFKPQVAVKAPVAPAVRGVPQVGSLKDLEDYYKLGMNQSWSEICGY